MLTHFDRLLPIEMTLKHLDRPNTINFSSTPAVEQATYLKMTRLDRLLPKDETSSTVS